MIVAVVVLLALGLTAMVLLHRHQMRSLSTYFEDRLRAQDEAEEGRRVALYKQQKAMHRTVAASDKAVRKMVDHTSTLRDETIGLQQRMDARLEGGDRP